MAKKNLLQAKGLADVWSQPTQTPAKQVEKPAPKTVAEPPKTEKKAASKSPKITNRRANTKKRRASSTRKSRAAEDNSGQTFTVHLDDLKAKKPEYTSYRIKKNLYYRLREIAREQGMKQTGPMIERILESYCEYYDSAK